MLLSHNSFLLNSPIRPYCPQIKQPFPLKRNGFSSKRAFMPCKPYSSITSNRHLPELEPPPSLPAAADPQDLHEGIGFVKFFKGKNILITGATGLLGKVFVEKILRSTPVGKVYVLIKAKDKEAALDRLHREIISSELFTRLKEMHGGSYEAFVMEKLIPIVGDITQPNLGMDYDSIDAIRKDVHVIIHSAASTNFYERYDLIVDANVIAPQRVMRFAKTCKKLQLFTHVSTVFVSGRREGTIMEKPLIMGDTGRKDGDDRVRLDVADEISLLLKSPTNLSDYDAKKYFRKLGLKRAELFGWNTTYQLCKSMGEMVVNEIRGDVPLLVIRPGIIGSCCNQPLPGWIQGNRTTDPVIIHYGKGQLPAYYGNPQVHLDIIPADFVANTMIAAIAKHGSTNTTQVNVYHVTSSAISNPVTFFDMFEYFYEYFKVTPLIEGAKIERIKFFENFKEFSKYTREEILRRGSGASTDRKMIQLSNAKAEYAEQLCKMYEFVSFSKTRFDMGNTQKLMGEMSKKEQIIFQVDVGDIDWKKYILEYHLPGLKKHVINSTRSASA